MKLKGISKLVLAGTALAATAATLTTATYAWYVTNSEVTATGVSGQVESTSEGSLYIAKNKTGGVTAPDKYKTSLTFAAADYTSDNLSPQSIYKGSTTYNYSSSVTSDPKAVAGKYYFTRSGEAGAYTYTPVEVVAGTTDVTGKYEGTPDLVQNETWVDDAGKKIATPKFISFKYWLKSSASGTVAFKLTVDNKTANASSAQQAFSPTGLPDGVSQGDAFIADAVHALRMRVKQTNYDATIYRAADVYTACASDAKYATDKVYYKQLDTYTVASINATTFTANGMLFTEDGGDYTAVTTGEFDSEETYYTQDYAVVTEEDAPAGGFVVGETPVAQYYLKTTATTVDTSYAEASTQPGTPTNTYQVDKIAFGKEGTKYFTTTTTAATRDSSPISFAEGGDANTYYFDVLGEAPTNTAADGTSTDSNTGAAIWATMNITGEVDTLFEFEIWLEGSDADCWDSCRGQAFDFDFVISYQAPVEP